MADGDRQELDQAQDDLRSVARSAAISIYGGSVLRAESTLDTMAFESPTYFAQGEEISRILDLTTEVRVRSDSGNHDSDRLMRRLVTEGLDDPGAAIARWRLELFNWFTSLEVAPDVLMVHQDGLAQWLAGALRDAGYIQPLTIVSGHDHDQHVDR